SRRMPSPGSFETSALPLASPHAAVACTRDALLPTRHSAPSPTSSPFQVAILISYLLMIVALIMRWLSSEDRHRAGHAVHRDRLAGLELDGSAHLANGSVGLRLALVVARAATGRRRARTGGDGGREASRCAHWRVRQTLDDARPVRAGAGAGSRARAAADRVAVAEAEGARGAGARPRTSAAGIRRVRRGAERVVGTGAVGVVSGGAAGQGRGVPGAEVAELVGGGRVAAAARDRRGAVADVLADGDALVEVHREQRTRAQEVCGVREDRVELAVGVVEDAHALRREEEDVAPDRARVSRAGDAGLELRVLENDLHACQGLRRAQAHDHQPLTRGRPAARRGGLAAPVAVRAAVALLGGAGDAVAAGARQRAVAVAAVAVDQVAVVTLLAGTLDAVPAGRVGRRRRGGRRRRRGARRRRAGTDTRDGLEPPLRQFGGGGVARAGAPA